MGHCDDTHAVFFFEKKETQNTHTQQMADRNEKQIEALILQKWKFGQTNKSHNSAAIFFHCLWFFIAQIYGNRH